jgi:APA family basic amino acid/polyamine antiporter
MQPSPQDQPPGHAKLGLWDAVSIIVGIIVGVGIFANPRIVFGEAPNAWSALGLWVLGGLFALVGAFCFAELASTYPRSGGEYVYISRALGRFVGFLFAWAQLTVIRPGSIAGLAYIFAETFIKLIGWSESWTWAFACLPLILLTLVNVIGVRFGTRAQNLLTAAKVLGLLALVVVGLRFGDASRINESNAAAQPGWFISGMILVLWAYSGWHEAAYVAAEVKDAKRNLPLALILGTLAVMAVYLLVNVAMLLGLGLTDASQKTASVDMIKLALPGYGDRLMSVFILVSSLGAINGMIFTTARIYSEFAADHRLFKPLSHWSKRLRTPARALVLQGLISVAIIVGVWVLGSGKDSLELSIDLTAAVFWLFFLLTGVSLFILRSKDADVVRPFPVPLYPVLPFVYCCGCLYMVGGCVVAKPLESLLGLGLLVLGLPLYFVPPKKEKQRELAEPVGK